MKRCSAAEATAETAGDLYGSRTKIKASIWLPFLSTYRTMYRVPEEPFLRLLQGVGSFREAA